MFYLEKNVKNKYLTTLCAAAAIVALAGCASPTVITLKDGSQLETTNKPKYDEDSEIGRAHV